MRLTGYVKIPDIAGESQHAEHEEEIDIHNIEWAIEQAAVAQVGRGRSQSRAQVDKLIIYKFLDASSVYLSLACMQGKSFDEIVIMVRKDSGDAHLDYLTITLSNVIISSYKVLGTTEDTQMLEEAVGFSCEKVNQKYIVQADDHSAGDEHETEFDIAAGA